MNIMFDKEKREIICEEGKVILRLSESDLYEINKKVDKELYYRLDLENFLCNEQSTYDSRAIIYNESLMNDMVDYYTEKRYECDTGDPDHQQPWYESLNDTIEAFKSELRKYEKNKNIDVEFDIIENGVLRKVTVPDNVTNVVIPDGVTTIGDYAFKGFYNETIDLFESNIKSITIPNSVAEIRASAFYGCSSLTDITIPNNVKSIGDFAFAHCYNLENIKIPDGVISIGGWAFDGCSSLTDITIPNSVENIGRNVFENCDNLTIQCNKDSYAEKYAKDNNIKYEIINEKHKKKTEIERD